MEPHESDDPEDHVSGEGRFDPNGHVPGVRAREPRGTLAHEFHRDVGPGVARPDDQHATFPEL